MMRQVTCVIDSKKWCDGVEIVGCSDAENKIIKDALPQLLLETLEKHVDGYVCGDIDCDGQITLTKTCEHECDEDCDEDECSQCDVEIEEILSPFGCPIDTSGNAAGPTGVVRKCQGNRML
jgi:hypothetical protein